MKSAKRYLSFYPMLMLSLVTLATAQKWTTYTVANGLASNSVISIAIDAQDNKWFGTQGAGVSKFDGVKWTNYNISNSDLAGKNGLGNYVGAIAVDLEGFKWFGGGPMGNYGVSKFDGVTWTTYTAANGLANNYVTTIAVDKQGNKWFGTQGGGVSKFDGATWTTYTYSSTNTGLAGDWVNAIAIDKQGDKWFGARNYNTQGRISNGGVSKFNDTTWTTYDTSMGLAGIFVSSIAIDSQGNKWIGTYGSGISKFDGAIWTTYTTNSGLVSNRVISVAIDKQGNKWFGTEGSGVSKFNDTTWTTYTTSSGSAGNCITGNVVYAIAIDSQGNKWFGTSDGGVSKLEDTTQPVQPPLSAYTEGFDTTDVDGYGLDSAFKIGTDGKAVVANGSTLISYHSGDGGGFFDYSFDDLKMAAATSYGIPYPSFSTSSTSACFVIKKKDNTYYKAEILNKLPDNRYVFRYGANSTPNDRMLERSDYDRTIKYKPNNFYNYFRYPAWDTLSWEPPLPNDNHLLGYEFYMANQSVAMIDTSAPVNFAQWDSIGFFPSTKVSASCYTGMPSSFCLTQFRYYNLVAVYAEGKSDFLKGWTYFYSTAVDVNKSLEGPVNRQNKILILQSSKSFFITLNFSPDKTLPSSLIIYNITGQQIARISTIKNNSFFFNTSNCNLAEGLYIVKAELPDRTVLTQPFMVTK
jgi:ligand-binding sensor domain-containing protein